MVIGSIDIKVESDNRNWEASMETHGERVKNEKGKMSHDFCTTKGLVIGGTLFPHKRSHIFTGRSPNGTAKNQIDHVAIYQTQRTSLQDTRVKCSADGGSGHHLLGA